ncbi:small-conductance mechanosensitive channel [Lewinella aquimaris]|uniref:Small-conductance mechanosensitive channel n=1 Tax=Neolewinella aquimaris TaxID=1835722 RepID=A0A840E672_9BACT|nr:mechanosensitive ion channel family protein [Neolewinella aquimaris]MBB4077608.1 small-conductance mechanosensitive channel [Neolewinella aquimaris]
MLPQPQDTTASDVPEKIDLNPGAILEKIDSWVDGLVRLVPNILVGIVVLFIFIFVARFVARTFERRTVDKNRENLGRVAGGFIKWVIYVIGFLIAATIVVPTLNPGDLIAGLGVSSVAIGFAFKDILQNWLAGLLLLLRQPFNIGDQIVVNGYEGTVERIETRATIINLYNNERAIVPNSEVYTNAVRVKTANQLIRSEYDVGIGYGDDIHQATEVIRKAVRGVEGVDAKDIDVFTWDLAASWVAIRIRWWTDSQRASVVKVHDRVLTAVKLALDEAKIDMPYETRVNLLHDQTEATDGDRSQQREGWPVPQQGTTPQPRWKAIQDAKDKQSKNTPD